jgi:hypothetical protein
MLEEQPFNGVARLARMWRGTDYYLFNTEHFLVCERQTKGPKVLL